MKLALDTNAYTALGTGQSKLAEQVRLAEVVGLPITVLGELHFGFLYGTRLTENMARLEKFLASPRVEILHVTVDTARMFGEIATLLRQAGTPIQQDDVWIAALCKQYGFALATRDKGFEYVIGLQIVTF